MGFDISLTVRNGQIEFELVESARVHGELKNWCKEFGNGGEVKLDRKQVQTLLTLIFIYEIQYFDLETSPNQWHSAFMIPQFMDDGYEVFLENSY